MWTCAERIVVDMWRLVYSYYVDGYWRKRRFSHRSSSTSASFGSSYYHGRVGFLLIVLAVFLYYWIFFGLYVNYFEYSTSWSNNNDSLYIIRRSVNTISSSNRNRIKYIFTTGNKRNLIIDIVINRRLPPASNSHTKAASRSRLLRQLGLLGEQLIHDSIGRLSGRSSLHATAYKSETAPID